ncbi:hypothetical protein CISG_10008 [Coccidioides immitis RMSCC 3703]|uniref:Uncharacterized protein n=1 Tax=Coccidioides immitis RMSCC 3703 TaxID=454286 RepID=A0A0J8THW7_COCIT|nr:hypothetical protein CISG_10008 [Coccidioides immitis RMSCC 3703]
MAATTFKQPILIRAAQLPPYPQALAHRHRPWHLGHPSPDYTRALVVAKLKEEDTTWVDRVVQNDPNITTAVYVVDDPEADPFIIKNKGNELMPYLTYIIDNYENLRNITIFMHAHNATWHNNDFFNGSSEMTLSRLNSEHVIREGYMNLRYHIHPMASGDEDIRAIPEAAVFSRAWKELLPDDPVPDVLSQPCCSQFAVSAERIRAIPLPRYVFWRDWVLRTRLYDRLTGRVWEYLWQYIFTGKPVLCPDELVCACKGYGVSIRRLCAHPMPRLRTPINRAPAPPPIGLGVFFEKLDQDSATLKGSPWQRYSTQRKFLRSDGHPYQTTGLALRRNPAFPLDASRSSQQPAPRRKISLGP